MRGQLFIVGAILILIFLFGIYTYLSISDYTINLKKPLEIDWDWKSSNPYRLVYDIKSYSYTKFLNLSLPNEDINSSTIILFDKKPIKYQLDGNSIIFYYNLEPNEEKDIFLYYSNTSGEEIKFDNIPFVNDHFILKNYNLTLDSLSTIHSDYLNFSCDSCSNVSGPVFVKIYNSTSENYFFEDFIYLSSNKINLTAENYTNGSVTYSCDGIQRSVTDSYGIFQGNDSFGFVNISATINCSNNVWNVSLKKPVYILVGSNIDEYGNRFFGKYIFSLKKEYSLDYFNRILSHYSVISNSTFYCGKKIGGLLNDFGDLEVKSDFANNSFFSWNLTSNEFVYDGMEIGNGDIKLNGEKMDYKNVSNEIIGNASCGNLTIEFFNMSPVIYFELNSSNICNLTLPIGKGKYYKYKDYYLVENDSYVVEYTGDILDGSDYPYFLLRPNSSFYVIILKDKRDLEKPYFYNYNSICPKI